MAFLRLSVAGVVLSQLLSVNSPGWLTPGIGVTGLLQDGIPAQTQVIDQQSFNALHNLPRPSEADGNAVCIESPEPSLARVQRG
jgi:hypothetical protein